MQENKVEVMTYSRRKKSISTEQKMEDKSPEITETEEVVVELPAELVIEETVAPEPPKATGKIFLGEEDKRLLKKFNNHIVKKLGVGGNRSYKI